MEGKKLRSLLRFYKKRNVEIELKVNLKGGLFVKGKIITLSCIFRKYLVLQSQNSSQIKIFLECNSEFIDSISSCFVFKSILIASIS